MQDNAKPLGTDRRFAIEKWPLETKIHPKKRFWSLRNCDLRRFQTSDFDQVIEEGAAVAEVGAGGAGEGVAVLAVGGVLRPPTARGDDDAGFHRFGHDGFRLKLPAIVDDNYRVAVRDVPGCGIDGVESNPRRTSGP